MEQLANVIVVACLPALIVAGFGYALVNRLTPPQPKARQARDEQSAPIALHRP